MEAKLAHAYSLEASNLLHDAFTEYLSCIFVCLQQISQAKGILNYTTTQTSFSTTIEDASRAFQSARIGLEHLEKVFKTHTTVMQESKYTNPSIDEHKDEPASYELPMRDAQAKNLILLKKYQSRVQKLETNKNASAHDLQVRLSELALAFNREHMENLQIARDQQQQILLKQQEQTRKFSLLQQQVIETEYKKKPAKGLSKFVVDHKAQQTCREMDTEWRKLLTEEGISEKTVLQYLGNILSITSHPLGRECTRMLNDIEAQFTHSSVQASGEIIINNVHVAQQTIIDMIYSTYPELEVGTQDVPPGGQCPSTDGLDLVMLCVEMVIFPRIYPYLLDLFIIKSEEFDNNLDHKYQIFAGVRPAHMGIGKKFWLLEDSVVPTHAPYQRAIDLLHRLSSITSISGKLHCLVETSKVVVDCVSEFWGSKVAKGELIIGADDLVPILSFVTVKAAVPNMHAQLSLVEEFIGERQMIGETGYCLSTFQTCLFYISSLDWKEADSQHQDLVK